jgi:hypothetical protein
MKSPREVLLKRHESAETKLDKVRAETLAGISSATHEIWVEPSDVEQPSWLRELIRSFRPHLAALAGIWLVVFGLHLAARETSETHQSAAVAPSPEIIATLKEQKRFYSQLVGSSDAIRPVEPVLPDRRPRSEERLLIRIV